MSEKHHFRKVFKSDHLGVADLEDYIEEGRKLIFTIKEVRQFRGEYINGKMIGRISVAGKDIDANIAYFVEPNVKPLVLNATNSKIVKGFAGGSPFVEDWQNIPIELYIDENVKMKGEVVTGVRIKPIKPTIEKVKPAFTEAQFEKAKAAKATTEKIKQAYTITPEIEAQWNKYNSAQ